MVGEHSAGGRGRGQPAFRVEQVALDKGNSRTEADDPGRRRHAAGSSGPDIVQLQVDGRRRSPAAGRREHRRSKGIVQHSRDHASLDVA